MRLPLALCLALPAILSAQVTSATLAKHWEASKHFTLAVANAMPAEDYNMKPADPEMNFGQLMNHIAEANASYCSRASSGKSPLSPLKDAAIPKATALERLNTAFAFCLAAIKGMPDSGFVKMVGPAGRQVTAGEALWSGFTHTAHHRGQAEVYLRTKGIQPPDYEF